MTEAEVTVLSESLAGVVREVVTTAVGDVRADVRARIADQFGPVAERLAVLETRAPVPGPPGADGRDGLGLADFDVAHDGERTFTLRWAREDRQVERTFTIPVPLWRGTWTEGRTYAPADIVQHQRSAWICRETTESRPGERATAWQLMVMRGRDGKDAR